jgi:hypothetical protein
MKIEIKVIRNGWLVDFQSLPTSSDPLGQRGPQGVTFADTKEAICGLITEQVLKLPDLCEGP